MRILVATDAWHPQVNGVVRTLTALQRSAAKFGTEIVFLSPDGFTTVPLPTYPDLRVALPNPAEIARRIEAAQPDAIHIATEGPIGFSVRRYCRRRGLPFTTSFMTKFPEYVSARFRLPEAASYWLLRRFHAAARVTMASTASLMSELRGHGFRKLGLWTRGVDTDLFTPKARLPLDLPRPIFLNVGRIAVEKNLAAFLSLDLPGSKVVIGEGPQLPELKSRFPDAHFLGAMEGERLAGHIAAADVFVFPSLTDTFGIVQLEALASGVPVAAFPVTGPRDVVGGTGVGVLDDDLAAACRGALAIPRQACRDFALTRSWDRSAHQFVRNMGHALIRPATMRAAA
ncbi:glycosyltransferase family 4 protein [Enterovirga rhinocerotis]|uniref:Glycosyltransferase involved in cell wall biosynthesis n=1 Tax=Enterovirga rhinocerotis TaxID=1339210 RepID=A0A4R7C503_9HYPH|nr:glycosyltransferase family 1 protein [Enterovirga rhinocerotis]TDR93478.1 glycosyltransferase involved in cell wall biosynthesis [Enterovirga rhinocerotis]